MTDSDPSAETTVRRELSKEISPDIAPVIKGDPSRDDPNHRSFMGGSRFATRHSLFMVLSLIALGSLTALFYHADQLLSESLHQVRTASHLASLVSKIESTTRALNSASRSFVLSKDLRHAARYKKHAATLAHDLKLLAEDPAAQDGQKLATTLNDGAGQHAGQFSTIVKIQTLLGFTATAGIAGNAAASLAALEKRLEQLASSLSGSGITAALNTVKASERQMALTPAPKILTKIQSDMGQLDKLLAATTLPDGEKKALLRLLQSHRSDITQLARTRITYAKEIARLAEINAYLAPNVDTLTNYAGNFSLVSRQESKAVQDFIRKILAGGGGGILLMLIFFGWLLMRSITKPTRQIAEIALELAHGNVSAPIPYLGNYDETGELANALAIFRENMLHADRLRKDLEVALKDQTQPLRAAEPEPAPPAAETSQIAQSGEEITMPGRGLIPNAHNLPSAAELSEPNSYPSDTGDEDTQAGTQLAIGRGAITSISHQLTTTSQNASSAAEEAEHTEKMVTGLDDAAEKIEDIEILMIGISDQMSLLAVQTALLDSQDDDDALNLIHLDKKRNAKNAPKRGGKAPAGQSVNDRIETIQGGTKRAIKAVQNIGRTVKDVNEVAKDFAATASKDALEAANELLAQSEDLRAMLDNLLGRVDGSSAPVSQPKTKD